MDINKLGDFKIRGSVDTQFRTNIAVERLLIASGHKVQGFTSFLTTLETIGNILLIFLSVFIIATLLIIYVLRFFVWVYKILFIKPEVVVEYDDSDTIVYNEITEEQENELANLL